MINFVSVPSRRNSKLPYNVLLKGYKRSTAITEANNTQESIKKALFQKKKKITRIISCGSMEMLVAFLKPGLQQAQQAREKCG